MKTYLSLTEDQFKMLMDYPEDTPIKMLNLLKFKDRVGDRTGEEAYNDYIQAAEPYLLKSNAAVLYMGKSELSLIGPVQKEWDKVLLVEYATKSDFIQMVTTKGYPAHLREQALEDSRLILCS